MFKLFRQITLIFLLSAASLGLFAQELPTFGQEAGISTGRFDDGLSYYIVPNTTSKGYANFALVQKGADNQDDARASLDYSFLSSKGVGYTRDGYISYEGSSAVFSFEDVPSFQSVALDSTIILLFDIISKYKGEQAIIACGDFDAARLKDRLYLMSLTVNKRTPAPEQGPYIWSPTDRPHFIHYQNSSKDLSEIMVSYASPRTPAKYMSTPQPLVSSMFSRELGYILRKRIEALFLEKDIPLGYVRFRYLDSARTDGDEQYSLLVGVSEADVPRATELLAGVLADIDNNGVTPQEFNDAKDHFLSWAAKNSASTTSNREYVALCKSNYLYGSSLASRKEVEKFFSGRKISITQDLSMFRRFTSALLDPRRNLTIRFGTPSDTLSADHLTGRFQKGWKDYEGASTTIKFGDSLALYYPVGRKVRLKSEVTDPQTGGQLWTFSNGMKVLFKKTDDSRIRYAQMIRGGHPEVPGIGEGESAFVGDMLELYDVSGMDAMQFRNMLESNGVTMDCKVTAADMRISGTAPSDRMMLLFRSLLSIQKNRRLNPSSFDYYRRSEALRQENFRLSFEGINAVTDSIMCPDFYYPDTKSIGKLGTSLPEKAERYFATQFAKNQDGIIVIEGNLSAYGLQKMLCKVLGNFQTGKAFSVRSKMAYQLRSGRSTYTAGREDIAIGEGTGANMAMAAERPFTMQAWCAFRIAVEHIRRELVLDLADQGQYFEVTPDLRLLPTERIAIYINCRPCPSEGLPAEVEPADPMEVMNRLRSALSRIASAPLSPSTLKGLKDALSTEMAGEVADPDYLMEAVLRRNSEGKDMISNYQTYLSKVTVQDVYDVISALDKGSKVEYVIK
ncbi:MAG: hypothetical protein K6F21_02165 [Bacteroidales bacterium]|nr:hypothetical protein [Bacteroidales bacterium]